MPPRRITTFAALLTAGVTLLSVERPTTAQERPSKKRSKPRPQRGEDDLPQRFEPLPDDMPNAPPPEEELPQPEREPETTPPPTTPAPSEAPPPAVAEPVATEKRSGAPWGGLHFEVKGFLDGRFLYAYQAKDYGLQGITPAIPDERAYFQANVQPSLHHDRFNLVADVSFYVGTRDPKHLILINELYGDIHIFGPLFLRFGRQRIIWGAGLANNPTDIFNPPKNPLDLQIQRVGTFFLPLLEATSRYVAGSLLLVPRLVTNEWSLPKELDFTQLTLGARLYLLLLGTDINLMAYRDFGRPATYWGGSISRVLFDKLELHFEGLVSYGPSPTILPRSLVAARETCGTPPPAGGDKVAGSLIGGARLDWSDQTFLSAEYFFNANGMQSSDFTAFRSQLPCLRTLASIAPPQADPNPIGHPIDPMIVLMRQHYLIASFQRPHLTPELLDDVWVNFTAVLGPEDLSTLLQLRVGYNFTNHAAASIGAAFWVTPGDSEFQLFPNRFVSSANLRISY